MIAYSTARLFITGSTPGKPSTTASTWLFGSPPKPLAAPGKILLRVESCTWISIPTSTRYDLQIRCDTGKAPEGSATVGSEIAPAHRPSRAGGVPIKPGGSI